MFCLLQFLNAPASSWLPSILRLRDACLGYVCLASHSTVSREADWQPGSLFSQAVQVELRHWPTPRMQQRGGGSFKPERFCGESEFFFFLGSPLPFHVPSSQPPYLRYLFPPFFSRVVCHSQSPYNTAAFLGQAFPSPHPASEVLG